MPTARGILKPSALAVELTDTHPAKAIAPQLADINSPSEQVPPFKVLSPPEQTAHRQRARAAFYAREAAAAVPSATLHDIFAAAPARPFRVSFGLEGERSFGFADRPNALERHDEGVAPVRLVAFEEPFAAKIVDYVHGGLVLGDPNIERIACDYVQTSITDALAVFYGPGVTPPRSERLALEERIERATLEQAEVMRERAEAIRAPARGAPDRKAWIDRRKNYERDWTEHHQQNFLEAHFSEAPRFLLQRHRKERLVKSSVRQYQHGPNLHVEFRNTERYLRAVWRGRHQRRAAARE